MLTTWILGSLFFIFIVGFIVHVLATDVNQVKPIHWDKKPDEAAVHHPAAESGKYLVSRDYQVIFSPRVFVDYPFGVKVVIAKSGRSEAVVYKPAETNGNLRSNVQRGLRESEYYGWPGLALEDPELTVMGGHVEFESEKVEPTIRVELKSADGSFEPIKAVEERVLKRDEESICSFWLNPIKSKVGTLVVRVSQVIESVETIKTDRDRKDNHELAAVQLKVPVKFFPIALR